jgi:hypothetical protein
MSLPEIARVKVTAEIPTGEDTKRVLDLLRLVGARTVSCSLVMAGNQFDGGTPEEPTITERIGSTFPIVSRNDLRLYAQQVGHLKPNWASRLWMSVSEMSETSREKQLYLEAIDMDVIRGRIRQMERSESSFMGLGKKLWNTLAKLNNEHVDMPGQIVLPWDDEFHHFLSYGVGSNSLSRQIAVDEIADRYRDFQNQQVLPFQAEPMS